jgi:hypothetical protein
VLGGDAAARAALAAIDDEAFAVRLSAVRLLVQMGPIHAAPLVERIRSGNWPQMAAAFDLALQVGEDGPAAWQWVPHTSELEDARRQGKHPVHAMPPVDWSFAVALTRLLASALRRRPRGERAPGGPLVLYLVDAGDVSGSSTLIAKDLGVEDVFLVGDALCDEVRDRRSLQWVERWRSIAAGRTDRRPRWLTAWKAAASLRHGDAGPAAELLRHHSPVVQQAAVRALMRMGDKESAGLVARVLADVTLPDRRLALTGLLAPAVDAGHVQVHVIDRGPDNDAPSVGDVELDGLADVGALCAAIADGDRPVKARADAATRLGKAGDQVAAAPLGTVARDEREDVLVRESALNALAELDLEAATKFLTELVEDRSAPDRLRRTAARIIRDRGVHEAVDPLGHQVAGFWQDQPPPWEFLDAFYVLTQSGGHIDLVASRKE